MSNETPSRGDVYQIVTNRIVELLEAGTVPWRKPWASDDRLPMNLVSGKAYRGINVFLLHVAGYGSPYWVTYDQARYKLGGNVRKGEKSSLAVFYKTWEKTDKATGEKQNIPVLRYYRVFNVEQTEGFDYPKPEARLTTFNPIEACDSIIAGMPLRPEIQHVEARAYYRRSTDTVNLPPRSAFNVEAEYYSTAFHELAHATGHETRLGRLQNDTSGFGSGSYAKEELIAEMSASFLCGHAGIENATLENSASYIANWLERLKSDRKLVVQAASAANKAADWILGRSDKASEAQAGRVNVLSLTESEVQ